MLTAAAGAAASLLVRRESGRRGEMLDREIPLRGGAAGPDEDPRRRDLS